MEEGEQLNQVTEQIIGAAIAVHRALGPGLLESAYEACLLYELTQQGLKVETQKPLINFNETLLKNGIVRKVNDYPDTQRSPRSPR